MNFQGLEFDGVPTDSDVLSDNDSMTSLIDEDVDFGYVYALFNFPQMVEGQVTVEEGEKLTLLDDSNSYWWLVQNLRDNQMGYIPADNIETAFGKLARVNRRKNLKLAKPDPEHMAARDTPRKPNARRVVFDNNPVTQVFITSPQTDDEDEYDDEYDAYDDVAEPAVVPSQADDDDDSVDYSSYYYSADADDADADSTPPSSARRVSIAPMSMGEIAGETFDSDSDTDMRHHSEEDMRRHTDADARRHSAGSGVTGLYTGRRESTQLEHDGTPSYYLSNEESDDGDSLSGVLSRLNSGDAEHRHTLHIQHVDAFGTADASVAVFADEQLRDVLARALAVFGLTGFDDRMALYAQFASHDVTLLSSDSQTDVLLDRIGDKLGALPASGAVAADVCTLLLADRSVPLAQLLAPNRAARDEEDPYAAMETGSRSILRTSIAASVSEGIASLASTSVLEANANNAREYTAHAGSADSDLVPVERHASPVLSQTSHDMDVDNEALPDSRSVVQGLLRSIPRPTSQPPQSAINRAKRNTVQLSAHGSVVDDEHNTVQSPPTRPVLERSASTHAGSDPATQDSAITRAMSDPAAAPTEPALGHSSSTLRPSSDTFTHEDSSPGSPHAPAAIDDGLASPTESDDTASSHRGESEDAGPAALTALAHSAPHRLKDPAAGELSLDDWLVILRGWGDTHDAGTASVAFYRGLLRDIAPDAAMADAHEFISGHVAALADVQSPIDDILSVSQGVGRRLDTLERELDDIARVLVHAN
ncbi:protein phosphatase regulator [Coemansia sp. RSA 1822]|nr:protein phosphatase regulator [Coemansia sp. RSA 638]KAJ2125869.1 protein phosphatase regulator [Coemansia sp. RSA 720]KAJ2542951.1 protein phosphatase regulator [Coemansia sp. RSA 1853]KAJ2563632.1 protein phosphatase regulator [Coemansia sp. RSA 1822]